MKAPPVSSRALPLVLLLTSLIVGCTTTTLPPPVVERPTTQRDIPTPPRIDEPAPDPIVEPARPTLDDASDATVALVNQAYRDQDDGERKRAVGNLERAIRIEPRNGQLWVLLAELQLAAGRTTPAEQSARKGLLFLARMSPFRRRAWLVIASALDARGETDEAAAIRAEWGSYRG